jgi:primosomal protein N' (replication factor Y)
MSAEYCNVALPVPLRTTFTYAIPSTLRGAVQLGSRVVVPFRQKSLVGVAVEFVNTPPAETKIRDVAKVLDLVPALTPKLLELGQWIASYYLAPVGEVFRAMLPPVTELTAKRQIVLTEAGKALANDVKDGKFLGDLSPDETEVIETLLDRKGVLTFSSYSKLRIEPALLQRLLKRGYVQVQETVEGRKRKVQTVIAWKGKEASPEGKPLADKERRIRALLETELGALPLPQLLKLAGVSRAMVQRMLRDGFLDSWEETIDPADDPFDVGYSAPAHSLNESQERAFGAVRARFALSEFGVQLLHGVTGSGKTEVYLRSVQDALAHGKTAIVLVPEIALTLWIGRQCRAWFGAQFEGVAVLHSALSEVERAREWWRVRNGQARVVVGTRSAVFAPVENLGLVIVDEEQENSFKQEETPRYHGRDVAIVRAKLENAVALLGSATPAMETYHNATSGKYELLTMASRVENRSLARVEIVDLRAEFQQTNQTSPISKKLHHGIAECLRFQTQALILINRRGYSWSVLCRSCGASVQCTNCSISLTYHKNRNRLECHYCGYAQAVPKTCPKCDSKYVYFFGVGSEHLEERLRKEFPSARIGRLDRDTVRTKQQYQETLGAFAGGALDILVGTQMLAKGHDFRGVTLVGVISADSSLNLPDFRAAERTFQLLTQVAGRAGRGDLPGRVLIQTYYPEHYAIQDAVRQDYLSFYEKELHFRRMLAYPPFTSLANIIVRDTSLDNAIRWSRRLSEYFSQWDTKGVRVLGPASAPLARLRKEHRFQFVLKSPRRSMITKLLSETLAFCDANGIPQTAVMVDMDPLTLM